MLSAARERSPHTSSPCTASTAASGSSLISGAAGGVDLITGEMASPEKAGRHRNLELGIYDDRFLPALTRPSSSAMAADIPRVAITGGAVGQIATLRDHCLRARSRSGVAVAITANRRRALRGLVRQYRPTIGYLRRGPTSSAAGLTSKACRTRNRAGRQSNWGPSVLCKLKCGLSRALGKTMIRPVAAPSCLGPEQAQRVAVAGLITTRARRRGPV